MKKPGTMYGSSQAFLPAAKYECFFQMEDIALCCHGYTDLNDKSPRQIPDELFRKPVFSVHFNEFTGNNPAVFGKVGIYAK